MGLTSRGAGTIAVRVVVGNDQIEPFRHRGSQGITQGQGAMLPAGSELSLELDGPPLTRLGRPH
ncbi:MAG: hypothetical protein ACYCS9_10880 [Candidatus Dormibacteria bacterium]